MTTNDPARDMGGTGETYSTPRPTPKPLSMLDATMPRLPRMSAPVAPTEAATPAAYRIPWRAIVRDALILWAATRALYLLFTYLAHGLIQIQQTKVAGFFGLWQRFDSNWYIGIAAQGYVIPEQVGFFPLYPALIRVFALLTGGNLLLAALLVGNLAALGALIGLGALTAWETRDDATVTSAMLLMLAFPFAYFFAAAYTEGLFIALAVFCLFFARRGQWGWAALFALLAGATRPTGLALIPPLAWEWLRQNGLTDLVVWRAAWGQRATALPIIVERVGAALRRGWVGALATLAVPAFFLAFAAFIGWRFKHPSLLFRVRRDYWGLDTAPPWTTAYREVSHLFLAPFESPQQVAMLLDILTWLAVAVAIILLWRKLPGLYNVYLVALLYISIAQPAIVALQVLQSTGRYLLPAFPIFLAFSPQMRKRPALMGALIAIGFILQGYVALRFLTGVLVE